MARILDVEPLTSESFAPFGNVIETAGAETLLINEGTTQRFHDLAAIDVGADGGHPITSIFRGQTRFTKTGDVIEIKMMERHPLGTQAFYPLQDHPYLVVVAPVASGVSPTDLRAFRANGNQGVNYKRDLWHHPLLVLADGHEFLVIDRGGLGDNSVEHCFSLDQGIARIDLTAGD